jgi:hypothetical protein
MQTKTARLIWFLFLNIAKAPVLILRNFYGRRGTREFLFVEKQKIRGKIIDNTLY